MGVRQVATAVVLPILITVAFTYAMILAGQPLGAILAVLLVYLWRRFTRRPWSGVGLPMKWSALPHLLIGTGLTVAALLAANAVSVTLGAARWVPWEPQDLVFLPLVILFIVLGQALPEELLWRGQLYDVLAERLTPGLVLVLTSVVFGALHLFSQSEARGALEVGLYAVGSATLGFACAASRARTGAIWMAVGVHSGFYFAHGFFPTEGIIYSVQLLAQIVVMVLAGLLVLYVPGRKSRQEA
jgi:membrane protease YdiL (CAAX protease family)